MQWGYGWAPHLESEADGPFGCGASLTIGRGRSEAARFFQGESVSVNMEPVECGDVLKPTEERTSKFLGVKVERQRRHVQLTLGRAE